MTEMFSRVEVITPDAALSSLARNVGNRRLSPGKINGWADKMINGTFVLTHQGIAFDENGDLLDGQHRLSAIVKSGKSVTMMVSYNVPRATFASIDTGFKRQAGHIIDDPNAYAVAAAAKILRQVLSGGSIYHRNQVENEAVVAILRQYPELSDACAIAASLKRVCRSVGVHAAILAQAMRSSHANRVGEWQSEMGSGAGLSADSPVLLLRNRYIRQSVREIGEPRTHYVLIAKAWNAFVLGQKIRSLRARTDESLPAIVGFEVGR